MMSDEAIFRSMKGVRSTATVIGPVLAAGKPRDLPWATPSGVGTPAGARPPRMAAGGLVARNAPPLRLPGQHFVAAITFWILGAAGLVWVAPEIVGGSFSSTNVVAVAHLFTLGWITTTILGALYQFLPVALLVPIRSERVAHITFVLYAPGLALFVGGMLAGSHPALQAGAVLFASGLLLFIGNLAATLRQAPDRNLTWWALVGAITFLLTTVILGVALAGNLRWGYLGANRMLALGVHLHIAIAGWVMLVVVGVAHRLLPMFLLSHGASELPGRIAAASLAAGAGVLLLLHHALTPAIVWLIAALLAGGVVAFLVQASLFFRHRVKPALDPGLRLAAVALALLATALGIAPFFIGNGLAKPLVATAYVAALVCALSLFVAGHYYKIVPFLIWFHRFGPLVGKQTVPKVGDLYAAAPANLAVALLGAGSVGLVLATLTSSEWAARPVAALYAAGAAIVTVQMFGISRRRPA